MVRLPSNNRLSLCSLRSLPLMRMRMRIHKIWRPDNPIRVYRTCRVSKEQWRMMVMERAMMLTKAEELYETDHNSDKLALPDDPESETNQETLSEHEWSEANTSNTQSALALPREAYAADSSSPSNSTGKSPPVPPSGSNSTDGQDYSDYEVPTDLAPDGVEVVSDYVPITANATKESDELAQPESDTQTTYKSNQPQNSASSFFFACVFVVAVGLFLF